MILDAAQPEFRNCKVYDCLGSLIGMVLRYDTLTQEVTLSIPSTTIDGTRRPVCFPEGGAVSPLQVSFILKGSYAIDSSGNKI